MKCNEDINGNKDCVCAENETLTISCKWHVDVGGTCQVGNDDSSGMRFGMDARDTKHRIQGCDNEQHFW